VDAGVVPPNGFLLLFEQAQVLPQVGRRSRSEGSFIADLSAKACLKTFALAGGAVPILDFRPDIGDPFADG